MLVVSTAPRRVAWAAARSASACLARASGDVSADTVRSAALKKEPMDPHAGGEGGRVESAPLCHKVGAARLHGRGFTS